MIRRRVNNAIHITNVVRLTNNNLTRFHFKVNLTFLPNQLFVTRMYVLLLLRFIICLL